jgi:1,4-alpha-glucan branching enzyme
MKRGTFRKRTGTLLLASMLGYAVTTGQSPSDSVTITFRAYPSAGTQTFVPGQFNNWGNNAGGVISPGDPSAMTYDAALGAWRKTYTFKIHDPADGRRTLGDSVFEYKFNAGGCSTCWYPDSLNPEQNPLDNNNSVLRLTRFFWFEYRSTIVSQQITAISGGLVHANGDTVKSIMLTTGLTEGAPLTVVDLTPSFSEQTRILNASLGTPIPVNNYLRLAAYTTRGDSVVITKPGYVVFIRPLPAYAHHGVTLHGPGDSTTFRLFAPGRNLVLLRLAALGQPVATAPAITMWKSPASDDWWVNVLLSPNQTYEFVYELDNARQIDDPWGRWDGTNGTRFSTGPEGLTADNYSWRSGTYKRPPLNKSVIYELHIGEFAGGYFGKGPGQGTFGDMAKLMGYLDTLGITAVEFMPVTDFDVLGVSGFSWGYDVSSYFALEPSYGTPAEFKALVDSAHSHGIAVILDMVFNHLTESSALWQVLPKEYDNPYFKFCSDLRYNEDQLCFFRDLDHFRPETQELVRSALTMWVEEYKVDGFRYDYTQGIGWDVAQPDLGVIGWTTDIKTRYGGTVYQIAEHLPESPALVKYSGLTGSWHGVYREKVFAEASQLATTLADFNTYVLDLSGGSTNDTPADPRVYLDRTQPINDNVNHDEQSLIYEMNHWQGIPMPFALQRDKLYATFMFASLGVPMLWEGMELGAPRGWVDGNQRLSYRPVEWNLLTTATGQSHYAYYKALIRLRKTHPALYNGTLRKLYTNETGMKIIVWGFEDAASGAKMVIAANLVGATTTLSAVPWLDTGRWYNVFDQSTVTVSGAAIDTLTLPGYTALIYSNTPDDLQGVQPAPGRVPTHVALEQNYPNPFNPSTSIRFDVPRSSPVTVQVYDVLGRNVCTLVNERMSPGTYTTTWDGFNGEGQQVGSGMYFYRLSVGGDGGSRTILIRKMLLIR